MAYYQRIRDLREDADKTQTELAEYLGTTAQYYGKYEKGEREIPFSRVIELADFYDVSLDYIAGRKNYPSGVTKSALKQDELELIKKYSVLSERNKGRVDQFIDTINEQQFQQKEA